LIPPGLIDQLRIGGRLVIPVGGAEGQELHVVTRTETGVELNVIEPVSFVPLHVGHVGG
jgi:protein-L-isoaspartate(D-aspartate) O-methyltransferase